MYKYELTSQAMRDLKKLNNHLQKRIITKLDFFVSSQQPLLFATKMINLDYGEYRFRVGQYRILFDLKGKMLIVHAIGHRRDIYR